MSQLVEINQGEIKVKFTSATKGIITFKEIGISDDQLALDGGFLRLVFDMEGIGEHDYFAVPTIEIAYEESCPETEWQCDFNNERILEKTDHHGHSTILLLDRKKLSALEHRHLNKLVVHAKFPRKVHLLANSSSINFFK
ncbi:MAG: hypothetical protein ACJAT1_001391 [Marivirga sp.]|jgi:hypothetical protein